MRPATVLVPHEGPMELLDAILYLNMMDIQIFVGPRYTSEIIRTNILTGKKIAIEF